MRILLVVTRNPYGRQTGRKAVLRTIVQSCRDLGHDVRMVAITDEDGSPPAGVVLERLRPPGLARCALNVLTKATTGRLALNECLYVSPAIARAVDQAASIWRADVVVADMVRTASLALGTGRPTVVDLDDLLSRRYRELAGGRADAGTLLGYYGTALPRFLQPVAAHAAARLVGLEARLVARRERAVARAADAVSLVAEDEATAFAAEVGRAVAWLPMAVDIPVDPAPVQGNPAGRLVFVGGLDYHANVEAVRTYVREVAPALASIGRSALRLRVVGHCPDRVRAELGGEAAIDLVGYVDDLGAELASARAFVAPIPSGTGVKTKVLEAMAAGLPVVSTPAGVQGIGAVPGRDCLLGTTGSELAAQIDRVVADPDEASRIGRAGRAVVAARFSAEVVADRWRAALEGLSQPEDRA